MEEKKEKKERRKERRKKDAAQHKLTWLKYPLPAAARANCGCNKPALRMEGCTVQKFV